ncbi:uncharacterized protein EI90DRAFT_3069386 [Cantharellus anzutake]|uniref:uncharacterized protein n=1 Tax=Cantharellus anzutake TaxID=1750568 RepID=UPI001907AA48|nr:uncharacterized protein EI90DRAFT_3069386 [Cantharellus anzutake]KAF8326874.1 hypothetical protein EI90DRAFT_3069386 [Cantharellus anzutake]
MQGCIAWILCIVRGGDVAASGINLATVMVPGTARSATGLVPRHHVRRLHPVSFKLSHGVLMCRYPADKSRASKKLIYQRFHD